MLWRSYSWKDWKGKPIEMWTSLLNILFINKIRQIFIKYKVSNIILHEQDLFAVYYDEVGDEIHHLALAYSVVHEVEGTSVYRPILDGYQKVDRNWIFLDLSEEIKPMSHYSDLIFRKLVEKVRLSIGGY